MANVSGIMFYDGLPHLKSLQHVQLERDRSSFQDTNAISYYTAKPIFPDCTVVLGHLEKNIAAALAPMMDKNVAGLIIRWY